MAQDIVIRGQEVTVQVVVDGEVKVGSFAKMENFSATPRTDLMDNDYVGEVLSVPDKQHHGWDFTFTMREQGREVFDLLATLLSAEAASQPQPTINLVVTLAFRSAGGATLSYTLGECVLKADTLPDVSGRTEYVKSTWSGKCREVFET